MNCRETVTTIEERQELLLVVFDGPDATEFFQFAERV
jgi:hypothetical protein